MLSFFLFCFSLSFEHFIFSSTVALVLGFFYFKQINGSKKESSSMTFILVRWMTTTITTTITRSSFLSFEQINVEKETESQSE